jgi:HSP20 family protein
MKCYNRPGMDGLFNAMLENNMHPGFRRFSSVVPATNIFENDENFLIDMALPGYSKEDFKINLEQSILTISSEKEETKDETLKVSRKEFGNGSFSRAFTIPKSVDTETIRAEYENGILRVFLPKKEEARVSLSKSISVN